MGVDANYSLPPSFFEEIMGSNYFMSPDGTYVTLSQVRFYVNRPDGKSNIKNGAADFHQYLQLCRVYNTISDMIDNDPDCGYMYWDGDKGCPSFAFPDKGSVCSTLAEITRKWGWGPDEELF
jgi:hypothetical protein